MREYPSESRGDPRGEVRPSRIRGTGVFARQPIRQGEIVQVMGGRTVSGAELEAVFATATNYVNTVQIGEDLHLLEDLPRDAAGRELSFNHSCDSNLWMADEVMITARRNIAAGEEMTIDYALFSTSMVPGYILEVPCNCGSPYCRGVITGDDWKLPDVQERYRGHFSPFINERIKNEL